VRHAHTYQAHHARTALTLIHHDFPREHASHALVRESPRAPIFLPRHAVARCLFNVSRILLWSVARREEDTMPDTHGDDRDARPHGPMARRTPRPIVLWRLRGATDDLRGLAIETSFGYALGLELDTELVLLHLQPSLECLIAQADRLVAALVGQGWKIVETRPRRSDLH
jgi:hypothetical protein